ncbi:leucine rich repeat protein [Plakobranchus ocellatus]|uniref:Leucine rich repeat protein n=1 Tax=Plakobranchus ocellatus TaxID=259542 RepID=A0AAV3YHT4_9GAST|nr:leucine rich repeat protein [Plakobranchus ocellatus]
MPGVTMMRKAGSSPDHQPDKDQEAEKRLRLRVATNSKGHMEMNLQRRGLRQVPVQVFHMTGIHVLRLGHNHLDHLPMMISYLRSLRVLELSHNILVKLPETLVNCRRLTRLDVSYNRLYGLPRTVGGLKELRHLTLAGNVLDQLPQEVGQLSALRVLNLHGNRLWHLPPALEGLRHLARLDLGDNLLDNVPLVVTRITSLKALDLSRNRLAALPVDIDQLRGLVELNLSHNKFLTITSLLTSLTRLKYLSLAGNGLKFLPAQMDRLQNLEVLHLQANKLRHIPALASSLKYYNVSKNLLKSLTLEAMRNLVSLTATHNHLESAPRGVFKLRQLKFLYLDNNHIEELPSELGLLTELRVLSLANNDLRRLPHRAMLRLDKLASFNVKGNYKLTRRGDAMEEEDGENAQREDHQEKFTEIEGNGREVGKGSQRKNKKEKTVLTTKGKITFDDDTKQNGELKGGKNEHANDSEQEMRLHKTSPRTREHLDFTKGHHTSTFPRSSSKSHTYKEAYDSHASKIEKKASKRFSSIRSLKDLFFGRPKSKISKSVSHEGRASSINSETRATMRPSDSLRLPLNYHIEDIERGRDGTRSWTPRRFSFETRNSSLRRHSRWAPRKIENQYSPDNTLRRKPNSQYNIHHAHHPDDFHTDRSASYHYLNNSRIQSRSCETSPDLHNGDSDTRSYRQSQHSYPGQRHSSERYPKSYMHRESSETPGPFHPANSIPLQFKASQSWADQGYQDKRDYDFRFGESQHSGYESSSTGPSWHRWGRTVPASTQPSRDHSVREVYASFATETPYSVKRYQDGRKFLLPEHDFTSASEDGGYVSNLRSYRSEPALFYSDEEMDPFIASDAFQERRSHRRVHSSQESLFYQDFEAKSRGRRRNPGDYSPQQRHRGRSVSPMSDPQSHSHLDPMRSNSLTFLHSGNHQHFQHRGSPRSSQAASRVTDYVDCEDTPSSTAAPATTVRSRRIKDSFSQFDHILSTADAVEMTGQVELGSPRLTPVALQHGHFLMKKKPCDHPGMTRSKSLDSILDYSPRNTNISGQDAKHSTANSTQVGPDKASILEEVNDADTLPQKSVHRTDDQPWTTDYSLLGVCTHVETMLNKNLLRPGIRFNNSKGRSLSQKPAAENVRNTVHLDNKTGLKSGQVSDQLFKTIASGGGIDQNGSDFRSSAMEFSQPQTFTLTSEGGQFMSSGQPEIIVDVLPHAVRRNVNITMQLLTISPELLHKVQELNHFVSNIFSMGPLVYFYTDRPDVSLNSSATITVPAPPAVKGGHLIVLSVRRDNSCLPVSSGYRSGHTAATFTTWHFSGKIALIARAKCVADVPANNQCGADVGMATVLADHCEAADVLVDGCEAADVEVADDSVSSSDDLSMRSDGVNRCLEEKYTA